MSPRSMALRKATSTKPWAPRLRHAVKRQRSMTNKAWAREKLWVSYVAVLYGELNDTLGFAASHGWNSTRVEEGRALREQLKIDEYAEER